MSLLYDSKALDGSFSGVLRCEYSSFTLTCLPEWRTINVAYEWCENMHRDRSEYYPTGATPYGDVLLFWSCSMTNFSPKKI